MVRATLPLAAQLCIGVRLLLLPLVCNGQACVNPVASGGESQTWPVPNPMLVAPVNITYNYEAYTHPMLAEFTSSAIAVRVPPDFRASFNLTNPANGTSEIYMLRSIHIRNPGKIPEGSKQVLSHVLEVAMVHQETTGTGYWANVVVPFEVGNDALADLLTHLVDETRLPSSPGEVEPVLVSDARPLKLNQVWSGASFYHSWTTLSTGCQGITVNARQLMRNTTLSVGLNTFRRITDALSKVPEGAPLPPPSLVWELVGCPEDATQGPCVPAQGFACDVVDLPGSFKVWVTECPEAVDDQAVNLMEGKGYSLFSIPRADGRICTIISWNSEEEPSFLQEGEAAIADRIAEDVPKYGRPPASAVAQLRNQRPSRATTVRTSSYCDLKGRALLLGDAAHSTGGTLGQGCNSALADAVELDKLLAESASGASVVERVGARFSQLRQPEGLALWKLLQLPPRGPLRLPYLAAQAASGLFSRLLPGATAPVQSLLSETTTASGYDRDLSIMKDYAEIVARNALWVDAALEDAPGQGVEVFE